MIGEERIGGYTLFFDFDALCEAEKLVGPLGEALARLNRGSLTDLRALTWAGLRRHHADIDVPGAGGVIQKVGFQPLGEAIGRACTAAFGNTDESAEGKAGKPVKQTG